MYKIPILQGYKQIKKLGKGGFGEVILVKDPEQKLSAVKIIPKKMMSQHSIKSLKYEIQIMQGLNSSHHIVKLLELKEDSSGYYLLCEYCNQGDLSNFQGNQPKKVFTLNKTIQILSEVIRGLFQMHEKGILHRDIKPQNILVHQDNDSRYSYKLADLGFAKYIDQIHGTILGTEKYISPQVFSNQKYGFEVDMWGFGVTMFFMLNLEYPFNINQHVISDLKTKKLKELAKDFSYRQAVAKTKLKRMENCTPEIEDLFKKIFEPQRQKRITFSEIREHSVFKEFFPEGAAILEIVYRNKQAFKFKISDEPQAQVKDKSVGQRQYTVDQKNKLIYAEHSKTVFLHDLLSEISKYHMVLNTHEMLITRYLLAKIHQRYLRQFIDYLTPENLQKKYPNNSWEDYFKQHSLQIRKRKQEISFSQEEMKLDELQEECERRMPEITKIKDFSKFPQFLKKELRHQNSPKALQTQFYFCCRSKQWQGQNYAYLAIMMLICAIFRKIYVDSDEEIIRIFSQYNKTRPDTDKILPINFTDLKKWLSSANRNRRELKNIYKSLTSKYLPPKIGV